MARRFSVACGSILNLGIQRPAVSTTSQVRPAHPLALRRYAQRGLTKGLSRNTYPAPLPEIVDERQSHAPAPEPQI